MGDSKTNCLVIGIGNEFRNDDSIGIILSRMLEDRLPPSVKVVESNSPGVELMEIWKDYNVVFIIDAASSGSEPGTIFRFDVGKETLSRNVFNYSSHSFSLAETVEFARKLNRLPQQLIVFGIEGNNFNQGISLTIDVGKICDTLLDFFAAYITWH